MTYLYCELIVWTRFSPQTYTEVNLHSLMQFIVKAADEMVKHEEYIATLLLSLYSKFFSQLQDWSDNNWCWYVDIRSMMDHHLRLVCRTMVTSWPVQWRMWWHGGLIRVAFTLNDGLDGTATAYLWYVLSHIPLHFTASLNHASF